jgi:hypothetical protein
MPRFSFSKEKSDDPVKLIREAQERRLGDPTSTPAASLPISEPVSTIAAAERSQETAVLREVYLRAVLLAMKVLTTYFPMSPYPILLMSRVRGLAKDNGGLGLSTPLYNTFLAYIWAVKSSVREVVDLVQQMQFAGIAFSQETYTVLENIAKEREQDLSATIEEEAIIGGRGKAFWQRYEIERFWPRLLDLMDVVAGRVAAKRAVVKT